LRRDRPFLAIALKLSAVILITAMTAAVKGLGGALPLGEVVFVRGGTSLLAILFIAWRTRRLSTLNLRKCFSYAPRTISATLGTFASFAALSRAPLADVTAATFTMPIFATVLAMSSGERVHPILWCAVGAGFVGMLIIVGPNVTIADASMIGILLALASAVFGALVNIFVRGMSRLEHPIAIAFYFAVPTTLAAACTAMGGSMMPRPREWFLLGLIGLFGTGIQIIGNASLRYARVALLAPLDYTAIVLAALAGYLLFDEVPRMSFWAGATLLMLAGLLAFWSEYRSRSRLVRKPSPPRQT